LDELVADGSYIYNPVLGGNGFLLNCHGNHGITVSLISEFDINLLSKTGGIQKGSLCVEATSLPKVPGKA